VDIFVLGGFFILGCLFWVHSCVLCLHFWGCPDGFGVALVWCEVCLLDKFRAVLMTNTGEWRNLVTDFDCRPAWLPTSLTATLTAATLTAATLAAATLTTAALTEAHWQQLWQQSDNRSGSDSPKSVPWPCSVDQKPSSFNNAKSLLVRAL